MSCKKLVDAAPVSGKIAVIDAWITDGGLDLRTVKQVKSAQIPGLMDVIYECWLHDGFSVKGGMYWIAEPDRPKQYVWIEVAIASIDCAQKTAIMEFALERSRMFPSIFKIGCTEGLIALVLRGPADGISDPYFSELIYSLSPCSSSFYKEIHERFGLRPLEETMGATARPH